MAGPVEQGDLAGTKSKRRPLPFRRRLAYATIIYVVFLLLLVLIEVATRLTLPHISSLDLFVSTPQQRMQVADPNQSVIFEGDPLLLWRLKPNLNHVIWDYTILSTNAQGYRANYPIGRKPAGTYRIVCLGDSVTFGYRVPAVWPDRPTEYDPTWLPFPMLIEKELRAANPTKQIEAFAMAVPGYTSYQGLAWLRRDIDLLQPDLVIASFGWNDVSLSDVPDRDAIPSNWYAFTVRWLIDHSQAFAHTANWLRPKASATEKAAHKPVSRVSDREYIRNMDAIVDLARSRRSAIIVMGAPYRDSTTNPQEAEMMTRYRSSLAEEMKQANVPYLQILELTEAAGSVNAGFFGELIHPNHMGHRLIASELLKLIARDRLLGDVAVPNFVP